MPKQNIKELYKVGTFEFKKDYRIKISENTHSIGSETETIELLDPKDLEQIQREKFKILHIGAIQVAAKPLTRLGLGIIFKSLSGNHDLKTKFSI